MVSSIREGPGRPKKGAAMDSCMLIVIVGKGQAKTAMKAAREAGACGGTVFSARGTASSTILAALGLGDSSKEVLFSVTMSPQEEKNNTQRKVALR